MENSRQRRSANSQVVPDILRFQTVVEGYMSLVLRVTNIDLTSS
jgi:hypothetical protein